MLELFSIFSIAACAAPPLPAVTELAQHAKVRMTIYSIQSHVPVTPGILGPKERLMTPSLAPNFLR